MGVGSICRGKFPLQCRAYTRALPKEKSVSPLFPGTRVAEVAKDWCITVGLKLVIGKLKVKLFVPF